MSRAEKAGELVLKAIECNKRNDLREAVRHLDEAIDCIQYAMNYENYGSTGQHIMKQKLKQYTKYVGKLRAKLPPEEDVGDAPHGHTPKVPQTTAIVHQVTEDQLITTALEEPQHVVTYPQLIPTSIDEPDCGQLTTADRLQATQVDTTNTSQDDHQTELLNKIKSPTLRPAQSSTASSTPGDGLFRMLPGEADYKNLETAINFAKKATQADTENSLAEALDLYNKAIEFFHLSTNGELNTELGRQHVRPQVDYCESRAEVISRVLQSDRSGYLSTDDDMVDRDSTSDLGDRVGDAATLQRRPVDLQAEIVGLDVVRSVLLDAATSSTGSFRSILLVGATGTGKTSVVDNLFRNTSRPYIYKDAAVLTQLDAGIDESLIDIFEGARQVKPCVIFLDKIDELFPRGRQQNEMSSLGDPHRQLSEQLTEQLTDFDDRNKEIIFISATDCPWFISPEVRDRFDTVIYTPLPGAVERLSIAKLNTADLLHSLSEEDFVTIAQRTHGFTGADIDSVIRSAMVSTIKELQKATHFKEVRFTDDNNTVAWTPCSPEDPAGRQMLWSDVVQVHPPEITMKHVMESLEDRCSSAPASEVYRLLNWVLQTGKALPEQAELVRNRPEEPSDLPPGPEEVAATLATIGIGVSHPPYQPQQAHSQQHQDTHQDPATEQPPVQGNQQSRTVETCTLQGSSHMEAVSEVGLAAGVAAAVLAALSCDSSTPTASYVSTTTDMSTQTEIDESASFSYYLDYPGMGGSMCSMGPVSVDAFCQTDCGDEPPQGLLIIPEPPKAVISPGATVYRTPSTDVPADTMSTGPRSSDSTVFEAATEQQVAAPGPQQAPEPVRTQEPHSDRVVSGKVRQEQPPEDITLYSIYRQPLSITSEPTHKDILEGQAAATSQQHPQPIEKELVVAAESKRHPQPIEKELVFTAEPTKVDPGLASTAEPERPQTDQHRDGVVALAAVGIASEVLLQTERSISENDDLETRPEEYVSPNDGTRTIQTVQDSWQEEVIVDNTGRDTTLTAVPLVASEVTEEGDRIKEQTVVPNQDEEIKACPQVETNKPTSDEMTPVAPEQDKGQPEEATALPEVEKDKSKGEEVTSLPTVHRDRPKPDEMVAVPKVEGDKSKPEEVKAVPKAEHDTSKPKEITAVPQVEEDKTMPEEMTKVEQDTSKPGAITELPRVEQSKPVPEPETIDADPLMTSTPVKETPTRVHPNTPAAPAAAPEAVRELLDVSEVSDNKDKGDVETSSVQPHKEEETVNEIPTIITTPPTPDTIITTPPTPDTIITTPPTPDTVEPVVRYDMAPEEEPTPLEDNSQQNTQSDLTGNSVTEKEESKPQTAASPASVPESGTNSNSPAAAPDAAVEPDAGQHDLQQEEPQVYDDDEDYFFSTSLTSIKEEEEVPPAAEAPVSSVPDPTPAEAAPPTESQPEVSQVPPSVQPAQPAEEQVGCMSNPPASDPAQLSKEKANTTSGSEKVPESGKVPESDEAVVRPAPPAVQRPAGAVPTVLTLAMEEQLMKEQLRKMAETGEEAPPASVDEPDAVLKDGVSVSKESAIDNQPPSGEGQRKSSAEVPGTWL